LVGKSGSGKSELEKQFKRLVSFTTRKMRDGEIDGVHYHFLNKEDIEPEILKFEETGQSDIILEYSEYAGNYYGNLWSEYKEKTKDGDVVAVVTDLPGALSFKKVIGENEVITIWVEINENIRLERLMNSRKNESPESLLERINEDHRNHEAHFCDYTVENNEEFETTLTRVKEIISLAKSQSKKDVLNTLNELMNIIPEQIHVLKYYDLLIRYDMYEAFQTGAVKLQHDLEYLDALKDEYLEQEINDKIDHVHTYVAGLLIAMKMLKDQ
jgi:guanylate kinase